jgi:hypothetical protein
MEQQVMYRFSKMELEQFAMFEENCNSEPKEVQFQTEAQFSYDTDNYILCSKIIVNMSAQEKPLVKAELKSYFNLLPESVENLRKDGRIMFAPPLLVQFASLCYGSIRGVIFTKTLGTPLNSFIVPPVYFGNLIDKGFVVEE